MGAQFKNIEQYDNKVHERTLRVIPGDDFSDFESLMQNNKDIIYNICSHHKNIQSLMIEIFKITNELAPSVMDSMLERRNEPYNLRKFKNFLTGRKKTVYYRLETLSYQSPQL